MLEIMNLLSRALGTRALIFTALAMTFVLVCWAMFVQTVLTSIVAGCFAGGVLLPVMYMSWKKE